MRPSPLNKGDRRDSAAHVLAAQGVGDAEALRQLYKPLTSVAWYSDTGRQLAMQLMTALCQAVVEGQLQGGPEQGVPEEECAREWLALRRP